MSRTQRDEHHGEDRGGRGLGGFLRSLLSGIPWSERAKSEETLHFERPPGGAIRIDNANANTCVIGEDRDDIEIAVSKTARAESEEEAQRMLDGIRVVAREDGAGELEFEVDIPARWNRRGKADLALKVPRDVRVLVLAANGRVNVEGMHAHVKAKNSNGVVRVGHIRGDVEIHTSNAKVRAESTCGRLLARSSNGKIELNEHEGSVDAATSNGTICCELSGVGKGGVQLATSNGRILLELPDEVDGDLDVRVDNGVIRNQRDLEGKSERAGRLRGTLGVGGKPIRLRASNGTITLR
ncbi:MAG: DUF4097 family beta strand repeat-containing protein [Myxococcota bacterium]|nr:DUF4097 family beta strand repeat-containing protein [Myxococcota bacterium]